MLVSIEVGKAPDTPVRELEMQDTPPCQYSHRSASGRKPMAAVQGRFSVCRSPAGSVNNEKWLFPFWKIPLIFSERT